MKCSPAVAEALASLPSQPALSPEERAAWTWTGLPDGDPLPWLLLRWRVDPVCFAVECLRIILQPYQAQILLDLAGAAPEVYEFYGLDPSFPKLQVLVPSGHGLGKTRVEAVAIWWHKITHAFSLRLCTAPTSDQLTGRLWGEVRKMYRRLKKAWPALADDWEVLGGSIVHKNPDYGDWVTVARTARADKPEGLQGAHAMDADDEFGQLAEIFQEEADSAGTGGILVIVEEASGVEDAVRETLQGALSEEGARFLACGNCTRPDGWFASDIDATDRYAVHPLDCRMSDRTQHYALPYRDFGGNIHRLRIRGFVRPAYWEEIIAECDGDEDDDRVRVRVRGMKPRSAFEQTIRSNWIDECMARPPHEPSYADPAIISLDFGLTADKHGLAVRQGFNIRHGDEWLPKDRPDEITLDAAQRAIDAQEIYNAKYIIGDSNGVGRGAMEYLSKYYRERPDLNVTVIHFNAGEGAVDKARYFCRRDEMWFKYGRRFFADPRTHLPTIPGLNTQLTAPTHHEDHARRVRLESKEDVRKRTGQASGNLADAILQSLLVDARQLAPPPKEEAPAHPKVFVDHFRRWRHRLELGSGIYIR